MDASRAHRAAVLGDHALVTTLRCVIVDDSASVLRAAGGLLGRQGIDVVGVASTAAEAVTRVRELSPDVVLIDIALGSDSGFALARELGAAVGGRPAWCILMSTHDEIDYASLIAESPALGFISKADLSADAIRRLLSEAGY
jgi:DNA-binding NarL/FixJ family response regulator